MTKTEVIKLLTYLNHCYPGKFKFPKTDKRENKVLIQIWYGFLKLYDSNTVSAVLKKLIIISGHWPPTVGEIVKEIETLKLPAEEKITAGEAWSLVLRAVRTYGYYNARLAMRSLPAKVRETVEHFGGFAAICHSKENDNYVRSHFLKLYQEVNRENEELMYLPDTIRDELLKSAQKNKNSRELLI
jgi:hypothetical protein